MEEGLDWIVFEENNCCCNAAYILNGREITVVGRNNDWEIYLHPQSWHLSPLSSGVPHDWGGKKKNAHSDEVWGTGIQKKKPRDRTSFGGKWLNISEGWEGPPDWETKKRCKKMGRRHLKVPFLGGLLGLFRMLLESHMVLADREDGLR